VAESAAGELRYLMPDGLGSIRQAVDSQGEVAVYHEFDPYGSPIETGGDPYGFTGEWWEDEVALLHLRARWYAPGVGIFLSRDQWPGTELRPQSMNGWNYVEGNPVNRRDPSGLNSEPEIPNQTQWTDAGGLAWEHSLFALERLVSLREHVVAAAQRHNFVPQRICTASPTQNQLMYTLGAIVYRESLGFDEEGPPQVWADLFGANFSIGIVQIRPDTTAREIEEADLLYNPGVLDEPLTNPTPYQAPKSFMNQITELLGKDSQGDDRVNRLMDPVWAIEYAAGNMELARRQGAWNSNPQYPALGRPMMEWEKMAAWYNTGVINLNDVDEDIREIFWKTRLEPYLVGTFSAMQAIQNLDLLGVKSKCDANCSGQ